MKTKTLLAMGLCAAIGLTTLTVTTAFADDKDKEHKEHKDDKGGKTKVPDTAEGILKAIHEKHAELTKTVADKKLADVHHLAFAIRDLANGLLAKAEADKKAKVEGTVRNIARLAKELDKWGDDGDQLKTEGNLKKLDGVLKVLCTQFEHKHHN